MSDNSRFKSSSLMTPQPNCTAKVINTPHL